jgi:hypothetical protein
MADLAVLTPSFAGDASLFAGLHESVRANTAPSVVHHVVVPPSDARLFRRYEGARCRVWTHRDLLPRHCVSVPYAAGLTISLRRPWLPVRGWVVQQIMKMAGTAAIDARAVVIMDSDAVLLRKLTLEQLIHDGRLWHFRRDDGVVAGMNRHLVWHQVARRLLGLPGSVSAPAPDYISPIAVWDPAAVRALMGHIEDSTGQNWIDAVAGELHISEFVLYGVFVDYVRGGMARFAGPLCHNYYARIPLSHGDARAFAAQMPAEALGAMISSHSHTPLDVRRETFRWCGQMVDGSAWTPVHDPPAQPTTGRRSFKHRCMDGAMVLAQLSAVAPAGLG